jgi:hypothetical protein
MLQSDSDWNFLQSIFKNNTKHDFGNVKIGSLVITLTSSIDTAFEIYNWNKCCYPIIVKRSSNRISFINSDAVLRAKWRQIWK